MRPCKPFAAAFLLLATAAADESGSQAGEIFICNDGRTIELTPANRKNLKNDSCIAEWFKNQQAARTATEKAKAEAPRNRMEGIPSRCRQAWDCPDLSPDL